jgi:hypothetical protein
VISNSQRDDPVSTATLYYLGTFIGEQLAQLRTMAMRFVFAVAADGEIGFVRERGEEFDCVRRTGSLVCRQPEEAEVAVPLTIIEANPNVRLVP